MRLRLGGRDELVLAWISLTRTGVEDENREPHMPCLNRLVSVRLKQHVSGAEMASFRWRGTLISGRPLEAFPHIEGFFFLRARKGQEIEAVTVSLDIPAPIVDHQETDPHDICN